MKDVAFILPFCCSQPCVVYFESSVDGGVKNLNLAVCKRLGSWCYLQLAWHYAEENVKRKKPPACNGQIIILVPPVQLTANNKITYKWVVTPRKGKMLLSVRLHALHWPLHQYRCNSCNSGSKRLFSPSGGNKPIKGKGSLWYNRAHCILWHAYCLLWCIRCQVCKQIFREV